VTLAVGLVVACLAAALITFAQNQPGWISSGFSLEAASTALGGLTTVNNETVAVALAAGVAGMLALETRASSSVGVAVSVTTIPAAAYVGVAAGLGELPKALGAVAVLGMNVVMMVLGASITLVTQRTLRRRASARRRGTPGA
jgi:uncharacterized membrane protein